VSLEHWYCISIQGNSEDNFLRLCAKAQNIEQFNTNLTQQTYLRRGQRDITEVLFLCSIFSRFDSEARYQAGQSRGIDMA